MRSPRWSSYRVAHRFRSRTFFCRRAKTDSIAALSPHAPTRPDEQPDQQVAIAMPGNGTVLNLSGAFEDRCLRPGGYGAMRAADLIRQTYVDAGVQSRVRDQPRDPRTASGHVGLPLRHRCSVTAVSPRTARLRHSPHEILLRSRAMSQVISRTPCPGLWATRSE